MVDAYTKAVLKIGHVLSMALLGVLLAAGPASACAWVLWQHTLWWETRSTVYGIVNTSATKAECEARMPPWEMLRDSNEFAARHGAIITGYQCLPDTVDPRGPKGR